MTLKIRGAARVISLLNPDKLTQIGVVETIASEDDVSEKTSDVLSSHQLWLGIGNMVNVALHASMINVSMLVFGLEHHYA